MAVWFRTSWLNIGILLCLLIVASGVYFFITSKEPIDFEPELVSYDNIRYVSYDNGSINPFRYDHAFFEVRTLDPNNHRIHYWFDLETETIKASVKDFTHLIYSQPYNAIYLSESHLKYNSVKALIHGLLYGKDSYPVYVNHRYVYDLEEKEYHYFEKLIDADLDYRLSPDGRLLHYMINQTGEKYLIDLKEKKTIFSETVLNAPVYGWWSEDELFGHDLEGRTKLFSYDVYSKKTQDLLTNDQFVKFLNENNLPLNQSGQYSYSIVPQQSHDQLLMTSGRNVQPEDSWLLKLNPSDGTLEVFLKNFTTKNWGNWNEDLTHYLYPGDQQTPDWNSVFIFNAKTKETKKLFQGEPGNNGSFPRFYKDQIIFKKNDKEIWIMNMDGSGQRQLFPPIKE